MNGDISLLDRVALDQANASSAKFCETRTYRESHEFSAMRFAKADSHDVQTSLRKLSRLDVREAFPKEAIAFVKRLEVDKTLREALSVQQLADCLQALGKWDRNEACRGAALALSARLAYEERPG